MPETMAPAEPTLHHAFPRLRLTRPHLLAARRVTREMFHMAQFNHVMACEQAALADEDELYGPMPGLAGGSSSDSGYVYAPGGGGGVMQHAHCNAKPQVVPSEGKGTPTAKATLSIGSCPARVMRPGHPE